MTEQDIEAGAAWDPDNPPISDAWLSTMQRVPSSKAIRLRLQMTQEQFARQFAIPLGTVRDWEQNKKQPDSAARTLLRVIDKDPEAVIHALKR
jgi:putative transcriptional regulator